MILFFRSCRLLTIAILGFVMHLQGSLSADDAIDLATEPILETSTFEAVNDEPLRLVPPRKTADSPIKRWTLSDSNFSAASFTKSLPRTSGQIGLMLAIFAGLLLIWRLAAARSSSLPSNLVEVYGKVPMTGKQSLHLVRIGSRLLILIESNQGMQRLAEITDPEEVRSVVEQLGKGHSRRLPQGIQSYVDERHLSSFRTG